MNPRCVIVALLALASFARALDETEFKRLHEQLCPPAEEGWTSLAWKTSLVQACVEAAKERKPILMVVRAGHPLGCV